jgi:TonB family protein
MESDEFALAERFLSMALQSARSEGEVDGRLPSAYEELARQYWMVKLTEDATQAANTAILLWRKLGGENAARVASSMRLLAQAHEDSGRPEEAETLFMDAIGVLKAHYGADGAAVAGAEERLAQHYERRSRYEDAATHYKRAYQILTQTFGAESPLVVPTVRDYIGVLRKMNRHSEAVELESLLQQTNPAVHKIGPGVKHPTLTSSPALDSSEEARIKHVEGIVRMTVAIDENGVPIAIWVKEPAGFGLDEKAVEAVSAWRFKPGEKDGQPVTVVMIVETNMRLL